MLKPGLESSVIPPFQTLDEWHWFDRRYNDSWAMSASPIDSMLLGINNFEFKYIIYLIKKSFELSLYTILTEKLFCDYVIWPWIFCCITLFLKWDLEPHKLISQKMVNNKPNEKYTNCKIKVSKVHCSNLYVLPTYINFIFIYIHLSNKAIVKPYRYLSLNTVFHD